MPAAALAFQRVQNMADKLPVPFGGDHDEVMGAVTGFGYNLLDRPSLAQSDGYRRRLQGGVPQTFLQVAILRPAQ